MGVSVVFLSCRKQLNAHYRDGGSAFLSCYFTREKKRRAPQRQRRFQPSPSTTVECLDVLRLTLIFILQAKNILHILDPRTCRRSDYLVCLPLYKKPSRVLRGTLSDTGSRYGQWRVFQNCQWNPELKRFGRRRSYSRCVLSGSYKHALFWSWWRWCDVGLWSNGQESQSHRLQRNCSTGDNASNVSTKQNWGRYGWTWFVFFFFFQGVLRSIIRRRKGRRVLSSPPPLCVYLIIVLFSDETYAH